MPRNRTVHKVDYDEFVRRVREKFGDNCDISNVEREGFDYTNKKYTFICKILNECRVTSPKLLIRNNGICHKCKQELIKKNKPPTDYSYNKNRNRNVTSEYVIEFCKQYE